MGKTLILTETQIKKLMGVIINEQTTTAKEFKGGADPARVSHAYLSANFGLPDGAKHENYYYSADIEEVIKMSADPNKQNQFLSVFEPNNDYSDNPKEYFDYIEVNGEKLENRGVKVFDFNTGVVYAAHNGLMAIKRAMQGMGGKGGKMTITFGSNLSGAKAASDREWMGIEYNSDKALDQSPTMNGIQEMFVSLTLTPASLQEYTSSKGKSKDVISQYLKNWILNTPLGYYGFMPQDSTTRSKIIKNLTPKGFVTKIDVNVDSIIDAAKKYESVPDLERGADGKMIYNDKKRIQLNEFSKTYLPDLQAKLKEAYVKNFILFVENYLPNSKEQIFPQIRNVSFEALSTGTWHYKAFHAVPGRTYTTSSSVSTQQGTPGRGQ